MIRALCLAAVALLTSAPLLSAAQQPSSGAPRAAAAAPAGLPPLAHPGRVLFDDLGAEGAWASAPTYKAAARTGRLTFIPFLGSDAPRNQPLHLALERVDLAGEAIAFGEGAPARSRASLVLDRGPVVERLDCRPGGAELVIEVALPASAPPGELVVRYAAEGEAAARPAADGGLRFAGPLGDVRMGAASAVLPGGVLVPIETAPVAGGFEYRVPAAVVRASGDRVVIDPVLNRGTITGASFRIDEAVDLACDDSLGYYAVVQRSFSATDRDVFVYRVPLQGGVPGTFVNSVDISAIDWTQPAIAARRPTDDWLVVATLGAGANRKTRARWGSGTSGGLGQPFPLVSDTFMSFDPDVGVESSGLFLLKRWGVVLSSDISAQTGTNVIFVTVGGVGASVAPQTTPFRLTNDPEDAAHPTIAAYSGPADLGTTLPFTIAYARNGFIGDEIRVRTLTRDAAIASTFDIGFARNVDSIAVSALGDPEPGLGGERAMLLTYASRPLVPGPSEVYAVACTQDEALGSAVRLEELTDLGRGLARRHPAVATSGRRWTIAYEEAGTFAGQTRIRAVTGALAGSRLGLVERELDVHGTPFEIGVAPALVGQRGAGGTGQDGRRSLVAFSNGSVTQGAQIVAAPGLAVGSQYCDAQPNSTGRSAWIRAEGTSSTSTAKIVRLQDAPAGEFTLLLTASTTNFVPAVNGSDGNLCLGPADFGRFNASTGSISASGEFSVFLDPTAIPQANGTTSAMVGDDWYFQYWFRDATAGGSNLSNAVRVEFDH